MGIVVLTIVYSVTGFPYTVTTTIDVIEKTVAGEPGPAQVAGLRAGDRVLAVDGKAIETWEEFRDIVRESPGEQLEIAVEREGQRKTLRATPVAEPDGQTGEEVGRLGLAPEPKKESLPRAVVLGTKYTVSLTVESVKQIGAVFSPSGVKKVVDALRGEGPRGLDSPMGIVGMGRIAGRATGEGEMGLLLVFFASLIVFVGVINLVPLPPLDGGHLAVLVIEKIRGRPVDMRKIVPVAAVVLAFLLLFTLALFYLDIARPVMAPF
jgi:RIP metalloprotease RseP